MSSKKLDSRKLLVEEDSTLRGSRSLTDVKQLKAIALLDDGRRIITSERYGNHSACLAIYDADSLQSLREFVFVDDVEPPNAIGVVSDPDRVIVNIGDGLSVIDLHTRESIGQPLPMLFYNRNQLPPAEGLMHVAVAVLGRKELFLTGTIGIFDGGKVATVHCGGAPNYPSHLVTWDIDSVQLEAGPIWTPKSLYNDKVGVPDPIHRQFITGDQLGWVRFWGIYALQLVREWHIESPASCDRSRANISNNEIGAMALSNDGRTVAIGTYCGAIHIFDAESGKNVIAPLVPHDFDYTPVVEHSPKYAEEVTALQFFASDQRLIAGYGDGSLRVWDVKSGVEVGEPLGEKARGIAGMLYVLPRLHKAISASTHDLSDIRVWDLQSYF